MYTASVKTARTSLQIQIDQFTADQDTLRAAIQSTRANATTALYTQNAALPDTESFETNEKAVNAVILLTLARGLDSLSAQQRSDLEAVAAQCPLADGEAVLHARALLALYDNIDPATYNDSTACYFLRPATTSAAPGNLTNGKILVYPNPASQTLHIQYITEQSTKPSFFLYNAIGQVVAREQLKDGSGTLTLPLGHLSNGTYYYFTSNGHSGKVNIQN